MIDRIVTLIEDSINLKKSIIGNLKQLSNIEKAIDMIVECYKSGGKVILMGNGGSASDAQHICAEFVGRFVLERPSLPAIALHTDTSVVTAISNDYGYDNVFSRQIEGHVKKGDIVIGISTSGNSVNICRALEVAQKMGAVTVGLLGKNGGNSVQYCDVEIIVDHSSTARIQESHIMIGHIICDLVEKELYK